LTAAIAEQGVDSPARPRQRKTMVRADVVAREMIDALQPLRPVAA
jgi:hypothetical protein